MTPTRQNCWEFMGCGREAGGARSKDLGVCPAAADESFDGLNLGRNAGRREEGMSLERGRRLVQEMAKRL